MRIGRSGQRARNFGFTLLELLISIALLGFILVLLFGGLRLGVRSWEAVQQRVDNLNSARSIEGFLRREMEVIYPYRWKRTPSQQIAFLGERNKVNFIVQLPGRLGIGGLYAVSLEMEHNDKGRRLLWRHIPLTTSMQDFTGMASAKEIVLASAEPDSVSDIWLSYYGAESDSSAPRWVDTWESRSSMPSLIRIQIKFANGMQSPDFVVAPKLSGEVAR